MVRGLVVADDLTGACDTGHAFAACGYCTRVLIANEAPARDTDVLVVDTDSRYDPPREAADAVRTAIDAHPAAVVYKKIDSTLRGNLTAEIDAALSAVADGNDAGLAIVAPASPATGRTTSCGHHLVEGALVTDTEPGQDPQKGPASAHVPSLLAEATHPVAHIGIETVARGATPVADRLRELGDGPKIVTVDATHPVHLEAITAGTRRIATPTVYVGSAGLAEHVSLPPAADERAEAEGEPSATPTPPDDTHGVLAIVGSVAPATLAALDSVPEDVLISIDPAAAIENPQTTAEQAVSRARMAIEHEGRVVVTAAVETEAVDRALDAGVVAGLSPPEIRERISEALATVAVGVAATEQPRGVFLTGGDTAIGVLDALDATAVELWGESVETGIPLATIEGGVAAGSTLITKAGAFGGDETVVNCVARLQEV